MRSICSDHSVQYLRYRARHARPSRGDAAALRHLIDFLRREGVIPGEKRSACRLTPVERYAEAYEQYLLEVRALAHPTIVNYVPFIRVFLDGRFGYGRVALSRLCAGDVVRFVQRQAPYLHLKRAKLMTSALRSFLRYARYLGEVTLDLAAAVPIVANWSMTSIPRAISADHVRRLLASIDRHTALGRRDYAVLLLLARLGLRASEVAFLELDDIDWKTGRLTVRSKGRSGSSCHCSQRSAKRSSPICAMDGRPAPVVAYFCAPKRRSAAFWGRVGSDPSFGIRSSAPASMPLPQGRTSFAMDWPPRCCAKAPRWARSASCWGIAIPQTTKIYTKVDLKALRTLALPWPGGVR